MANKVFASSVALLLLLLAAVGVLGQDEGKLARPVLRECEERKCKTIT